MRKFFRYARYFYFILIALILVSSLVFALLQTKWAKDKIAEALIQIGARNHIDVQIGQIEGRLPFTWRINRLAFRSEQGSLELHNTQLRIAVLPLFNKTISINYFHIDRAEFLKNGEMDVSIEECKEKIRTLSYALDIPYHIILHRLKIDTLTYRICENSGYSIVAQADLHKYARQFQCDFSLISQDNPDSSMRLGIQTHQKLDYAAVQLQTSLFSSHILKPPFVPDEISLSLKGSCSNWKAFLQDAPMPSSLSGTCSAKRGADHLESSFTIDNYHSLSLSHLVLNSALFNLKASGTIEQDVKDSTLSACFTLPDLHKLSPSWEGSAAGELSYVHASWTADISAKQCHYRTLDLDHINAHIEGNRGTGLIQMHTQSEMLPLQASCAFQWQDFAAFSIEDLLLKGPGLYISGDFGITRHLCTGDLYAQIDHVKYLSFLFPQNILDAKWAIECQFSENEERQNVRLGALGKDVIYKSCEIQELFVQAYVRDVAHEPVGEIHVSAHNLQSPFFDFNSVDIDSTSLQQDQWQFSLKASGDPLTITSEGFWKKEDQLLDVEVTALSGEAFSYPFSLQYPFLIEMSPPYCSLSPLHATVGDGSVFAEVDMSPQRCVYQMEIEHLPLKLLQLLYPDEKFSGTFSANGFFDATSERMQGFLNAFLEGARLDKKRPLQLEGNLQAHLDQSILQTHMQLLATHEQFLDFSGTFPLLVTPYPWGFSFDTKRPISAELIAEGRIQDLLDFVNLGIHHATGQVSSRLFLSKNLSSPVLQGDIQWQQGSYENDLTGTYLTDIQAQLRAQGDEIELLCFEAHDGKKGSVTGEGKIALHAHLPYAFTADLDHFRTVDFNPIDVTLTGPLYIHGNTEEAFAQGNLIISHAEFEIPDKLIADIPTLPLTFIQSPYSTQQTLMSPAFPFHIRFELTADDRIFVTGKGLNSEWKGILFITGTNMNVAANGTLELIKGDYAFLGKTFKLTEGQIAFNDKPTPSATINLSGSLSLADMTITAHLRGPLSSPLLTFQSNPQLSTSAILARILFNKDLSDISQPEAIQLATTLLSLSGGAGPSVLEAIRKNLGVDRLTIASQSANPNEIAIQIGKYLTKGVMITLSQSATSSQIIVEVEFSHGFVFQAETQEEEEGKFSLKWTHSY